MRQAADLWFSPVFHEDTNKLQKGSIGVAKQISTVQQITAIAITVAMKTTATDILEVYTNLLPTTLLLQNTCYRAIMCITTHPKTHPLYEPLRQAACRYVNSHRTSLHKLTHQFTVIPDDIKTLIPSRRSPSSTNPWSMHIAKTKEEAITEHEQLTDDIQVYSDSSWYKGQVGTAATLFCAGKPPRTLHYHLGTDKEHTVFKAEEVGLTLAARLIAMEQHISFPISISVDNQVSIQAGKSFYSRPGSYLADRVCRMIWNLAKHHEGFALTIRWVPGHSGVHGNEEVDKHAKLAAQSR
jgi:ribonuclease HI